MLQEMVAARNIIAPALAQGTLHLCGSRFGGLGCVEAVISQKGNVGRGGTKRAIVLGV